MVITVSPTNPRSVRGLAVLATADRWTKGHTKSGRPFFVIPGSRGRVYWTDTRDCTCPDRRERDETCKHILAVRLWAIRHAADAPAPSKGAGRATCAVCMQRLPAGVLAGVCADCADAGLLFGGVAAIKAAFGSDAGAVVRTYGPAI